jgi:hypothetical protein
MRRHLWNEELAVQYLYSLVDESLPERPSQNSRDIFPSNREPRRFVRKHIFNKTSVVDPYLICPMGTVRIRNSESRSGPEGSVINWPPGSGPVICNP